MVVTKGHTHLNQQFQAARLFKYIFDLLSPPDIKGLKKFNYIGVGDEKLLRVSTPIQHKKEVLFKSFSVNMNQSFVIYGFDYIYTSWKASKYGVSSGPYFLYSVGIRENRDQEKLRVWYFSRSITEEIFKGHFLFLCWEMALLPTTTSGHKMK